MQFHLIAFEGPDPYSRAGGIASRMEGLAHTLADAGCDTHLWFIGDPDRPGYEQQSERLHLHRWCQWISRHHANGVYDGEDVKERDLAKSLPPFLYDHHLAGELAAGRRVVVMAEEWQTLHVVLHLDWILRRAGVRGGVRLLWNANNTFGFDRIDFGRLSEAATVTSVSHYMRRIMQPLGCTPVVIPNGLGQDAYPEVPSNEVAVFARRLRGRLALAKVARWDPDKRWLAAIDCVAALRQRGAKPLLIARGSNEEYGDEVFARAHARGLSIVRREAWRPGAHGLIDLLESTHEIDVLVIGSHLDASARRLLFHASDAVLANSAHEPFGLVGLETMAASGVACTGSTGEEYARADRNALVVSGDDPTEFIDAFGRMRRVRGAEGALRRAARDTAREYAWERIVDRQLFPQLGLRAIDEVRGVRRERIAPSVSLARLGKVRQAARRGSDPAALAFPSLAEGHELDLCIG